MKGSRNHSQKKTTRARTQSTASRVASGSKRTSSLSGLSSLSLSSAASYSTSAPSMGFARGARSSVGGKVPSLAAPKVAQTTSLFSRFFSSADSFFRPNSNRVLVKKEAPPQPKTASGILIPQAQAKSTAHRAEVVAVGPGLRTSDGNYVKTFATVGDTVLLPDFGGTELKFDDQTYHLFRDDDILGILPK